MDELTFQQDLTDSERFMFQSEMTQKRKSVSSAVLWCLFLGGVGAHQFYLGNTLLGMLYLLFFWTFVPAIIAFFELFTFSGRVKTYNAGQAADVAARTKAGRR